MQLISYRASVLWAIVKKIGNIRGMIRGSFFPNFVSCLYIVLYVYVHGCCSDDVSALWSLCWKSSGDIKVGFFKIKSWFSVLEASEQLEAAHLFILLVAKQRHCRARMQGSFQMTSKASLWETECDFLLFAAIKTHLDN